MGYRVAVVGATGNVGWEMLQLLDEREFPADQIHAVASSRSAGQQVTVGEDRVLTIEDLDTFDFSRVDIVLSSPGASVSKEFAPRAAEAGAVVVDNTSHFRMDPDVPLVVPEVNPEAIAGYTKKNIIANPNCSTIQMVVALKPLHDKYGLTRCVVSTYQSVSGSGKEAMDELFEQTRGIYTNQPVHETRNKFTKQIAFNCIPHIDAFMDDGSTKEEWKMVAETKKIMDPQIRVAATCVRLPIFIGHGESLNLEFDKPVDENDARELLRESEGISVVDHRVDEGYVTPAEVPGEDPVFISRIRQDSTVENGLAMWVVADNLRKGAALNTVQIAERLVQDYLK